MPENIFNITTGKSTRIGIFADYKFGVDFESFAIFTQFRLNGSFLSTDIVFGTISSTGSEYYVDNTVQYIIEDYSSPFGTFPLVEGQFMLGISFTNYFVAVGFRYDQSHTIISRWRKQLTQAGIELGVKSRGSTGWEYKNNLKPVISFGKIWNLGF